MLLSANVVAQYSNFQRLDFDDHEKDQIFARILRNFEEKNFSTAFMLLQSEVFDKPEQILTTSSGWTTAHQYGRHIFNAQNAIVLKKHYQEFYDTQAGKLLEATRVLEGEKQRLALRELAQRFLFTNAGLEAGLMLGALEEVDLNFEKAFFAFELVLQNQQATKMERAYALERLVACAVKLRFETIESIDQLFSLHNGEIKATVGDEEKTFTKDNFPELVKVMGEGSGSATGTEWRLPLYTDTTDFSYSLKNLINADAPQTFAVVALQDFFLYKATDRYASSKHKFVVYFQDNKRILPEDVERELVREKPFCSLRQEFFFKAPEPEQIHFCETNTTGVKIERMQTLLPIVSNLGLNKTSQTEFSGFSVSKNVDDILTSFECNWGNDPDVLKDIKLRDINNILGGYAVATINHTILPYLNIVHGVQTRPYYPISFK